MEREIKFRCWNGNNIVDLYSTTRFAVLPDLKIDGLFIPFHEEYVLMQYTGFKDKNGKDIFEGDIVRVDTTKTQHFGGIHTKVIEWGQKGGWHPMETHCDNLYSFLHDIHGHNVSEVIGNKYENPELLNDN